MNTTKPLDALMEKEMNRQEFLSIVGLGLASIVGLSTIIHMLTGKSLDHHIKKPSALGYNSGVYAGSKNWHPES